MAARKDGLPNPETIGDMYLAAILDEIRGLRQEQAPPVTCNVTDLRVKEVPRKRGG